MIKPTPQFWKFAGTLALTGLYMLWASYMLEKVSKPSQSITFAQYVKRSAARVMTFWNPPTLTSEIPKRSAHYFGGYSERLDQVAATCRECGDTFVAADRSHLMALCLGHMAFPKVDMR